MPELPEVETCRRSLAPYVEGQVIADVWYSGQRLRHPVDEAALLAERGSRIERLDRVGKYLLFHLGFERVLVGHLGMSGNFLITTRRQALLPHTHLRISLVDCAYEIRYVDPRRFGCAFVCGRAELGDLLRLGPDPLGDGFSAAGLHAALRPSRRDLKALLLDQTVVAGLGNIYVAESLFVAGLRPVRRGMQVSGPMAARLHQAIRGVLEGAVARRGTTLSDGGYVDAEGQAGENQHHLQVYGRKEQPCLRCGAAIRHLVQAGRSSYYCPRCQR